jgi:hypothetical protein
MFGLAAAVIGWRRRKEAPAFQAAEAKDRLIRFSPCHLPPDKTDTLRSTPLRIRL